jgi:hypothetical protein
MVTSVTKGGTQKLPKNLLRLSEITDMTIHWKALQVHFLLVHLVFDSTIFGDKFIFWIFLKKILSPYKTYPLEPSSQSNQSYFVVIEKNNCFIFFIFFLSAW